MILTIALSIITMIALINWLIWKLNCQAILFYCFESEIDIDADTIKKYREKVINKRFGVKKDRSGL